MMCDRILTISTLPQHECKQSKRVIIHGYFSMKMTNRVNVLAFEFVDTQHDKHHEQIKDNIEPLFGDAPIYDIKRLLNRIDEWNTAREDYVFTKEDGAIIDNKLVSFISNRFGIDVGEKVRNRKWCLIRRSTLHAMYKWLHTYKLVGDGFWLVCIDSYLTLKFGRHIPMVKVPIHLIRTYGGLEYFATKIACYEWQNGRTGNLELLCTLYIFEQPNDICVNDANAVLSGLERDGVEDVQKYIAAFVKVCEEYM